MSKKKTKSKVASSGAMSAPSGALANPLRPAKADAKAEPSLTIWQAWMILSALLLAALLPFSGRAFHIDDTLFVFAGKHIVQEPLNPYRFSVNWDDYYLPMSQITKNPPLACYYIALVGWMAGWSERALHLAFLIPALIVVLATYRLALRMTRTPMLAALATFAAPGFLVSAASVMCDTMMLAIWMLAVVLWLEGLDEDKPILLAASALLVGAAGVTKYFGFALIPLLLAYTFHRRRNFGRWLIYFLIPILVMMGYQLWTASLYTDGLLTDAAEFANSQKEKASFLSETLEGFSFLGGCMLPALIFGPWLWSRRQILTGLFAGGIATTLIVTGIIPTGRSTHVPSVAVAAFQDRPILFSLELTLFTAAGISVLALAVQDYRRLKDSNSVLLPLWVAGTFIFTSYFNWTVNARSILPLLPAAGILIARRIEYRKQVTDVPSDPSLSVRLAFPLAVSAALAFIVLLGDSQLGNSARTAAFRVKEMTRNENSTVWFVGHWGLQYYMEQWGAKPIDTTKQQVSAGDFILVPENNTSSNLSTNAATVRQDLTIPGPFVAITIQKKVGAGFYSSFWGPLPFFIGPTPPERYALFHIPAPPQTTNVGGK